MFTSPNWRESRQNDSSAIDCEAIAPQSSNCKFIQINLFFSETETLHWLKGQIGSGRGLLLHWPAIYFLSHTTGPYMVRPLKGGYHYFLYSRIWPVGKVDHFPFNSLASLFLEGSIPKPDSVVSQSQWKRIEEIPPNGGKDDMEVLCWKLESKHSGEKLNQSTTVNH